MIRESIFRRGRGRLTYVHGLVELSSVDDLPCDLDFVVVEVLLDLILVDGVNDWLLAPSWGLGNDGRGMG
jgi:hypothetical protein